MNLNEASVMEKELYAFPTSFAQQRLWFLNQLEPGSPAYNIAFAIRLRGQLKVDALELSLAEIVSRHETLRTTFIAFEGRPVQVVAPYLEITLPVIDLRGEAAEEREERARQLAGEEARRVFDLAQGPLLRATLLRLDTAEYVLLLTMHHIISDGWSMGVIVREMAALYDAFGKGQTSPLPELPIQYADFAIWQREWLEGEEVQSQLSYWKQQLGGDLPVLNLPFDRPRAAMQSERGAKQPITFAPELTSSLRELSKQEGVTMFMTLLAAFQSLLYRYTDQEDVCVGSSVAGRTRREIEGLVGFFLNTLVLRTDLSGNPTFRELLGRVREVALKAYANQNVPVEMLMEELQPERHLSHSPLFQVMFILQNTPLPELQLTDVALSLLPNDNGTSKFDLTLDLAESAEGIGGYIEYNSDLFDTATITRFIEHFQLLLAAIVEAPDTHIARLPLLSAAERHQLLSEWNETRTDYASGLCLHQLFEAQARRTPEAVAIRSDWGSLTYAELDAQAETLARYLRQRGVRAETLVGVCLERTPHLVVGLLGVLKAGGAYLPLDPAYPRERLRVMVSDAQAHYLLTQESVHELAHWAGEAAGGVEVISLDEQWAQIVAGAAASAEPERGVGQDSGTGTSPGQLAYVIYTSGSTGRPKGVGVQHHSIVSYVETAGEMYGITPDDRVLQFASISFDTSAEEIYPALARGATLVLRTDDMLSSVKTFLNKCEAWGITILDLPTAYWHSVALTLSTQPLNIPERVRLVIIGGEKALRERVTQWQQQAGLQMRLVNTYGPTEATIVATSYEVEGLSSEAEDADVREVPIGRAVRNAQAYVLDRWLQPAPIGVIGELHIGGCGLARGYLGAPELTAQKFIPHPFSREAGARLYKTGDLVRYRSDGNLEFLGRRDQQIKLRGFRIEPGEIEMTLYAHPSVREAVVMLREDAPDEKRLVAYVQPREQSELTSAELRNMLRETLPDYMMPSAFVLLDELPFTPGGKIDRRALPPPDNSRPELSETFVAPRNPTEELVAGVWREVLNLTQIGAQDNFFDLGGHSLLATQVIARLREELHIEVQLRSFFETPTVAGLSAQVEKVRQAGQQFEYPPIERVPRNQLLPLSFSQERLWFLSELDPDNISYHVPRAIRITGALDVALVRATFTELIRRHEILRTSFPTVEGRPVQVIHPPHPMHLPLFDLRTLPADEREAEVQRFISKEGHETFDFLQEPLMRVTLLWIGDEEYVLVLAEHHLIHDGWTQGVLMRDFAAIYSAFHSGQPSPLPDLSIQYADFAYWQRQWLQGRMLAEQLAYWKQQLTGAPPFLELPAVHPRPPVQSFRGAEFNLELDAAMSDALRELSRRRGVTLFMTMLAAFNVLLRRYTGQHDLSVGSGIANRRWQVFENLLGMIINTVVLRTDLSGNPKFSELLQHVRDVTLDAYAHQDVPFEKLVEELQPERSLRYTPLFQVMFSFLDTPMATLQLPGVEIEAMAAHNQSAKFDLNVVVITPSEQSVGLGRGDEEAQRPREITVAFEYSTDIFDEQAIVQLADHYRRLLQAVLEDDEQHVLQLPLMSGAELEQLLFTWNDTQREYPREASIPRLFEEQAARTPEAVAVVCNGREVTYAELNGRANQLAHYLRDCGVRPEVTVGLCVERSVEMIYALLGILKAGGTYLPLDAQYPLERLSFMLQDAGVSLLLTQQSRRESLPETSARIINLDSDGHTLWRYGTHDLEVDVQPDNLAYIMYTSGSTGTPKGVSVTHRNVVRLVKESDYVEFGPDEVFLQLAPISFDASTFEIWGSLLNGSRLVVMPPQLPLLEEIGSALREHGVTTLWLTAGLFHQMVDEHQKDLRGVRQLLAGGDVLSAAHVRKALDGSDAGRRIVNGYGPTESTTFACCYSMSATTRINNTVPIGRPIANTSVYILDANLQPVPAGVTGELYIGGDGVARGYFQRPELTAQRFIPDPFGVESGARLYRTGDLSRYLPDGNIEFLGRLDQQVKVRGFRIELGEIETILEEHESVRESAVVALEDEHGGKRLVAYLVAAEGSPVAAGLLRAYLQKRIPDYMVPSAFVTLDALPLTPNGKVDRRALPAPDRNEREATQNYVAPRTPVEQTLAGIWSEVLGIERIGVDDNFFELGGHSLLATRMLSKAREIFQINLPLRKLFETPTITGFAAVVEAMKEKGDGRRTPSITRLSREAHRVQS
jgi:amino acid adenylation domain-containing protein